MTERFGAGLADPGIFILFRGDVRLPLRLDPREFQLLSQYLRQFLQGQIDFQDMVARLIPRLRLVPLRLLHPDDRSRLPIPLPHPSHLTAAKGKARDLDLRERDTDQILPLPTDQFPAGNKTSQLFFDFAPDDLFKTGMVRLNLKIVHSTLKPCLSHPPGQRYSKHSSRHPWHKLHSSRSS